MSALVVLYMVQELLLPGHVENVAGMGAWRGMLEAVFGPMTTQALASQTFGFYSGFIYFTPVFGGLLADRVLGAKRTVVIGALLMSAGHFAMAFEQSFLFALLLLILGSGCLKGNIAAQIGHLYPLDDESRRTRAFTLFSTAINVGAVLGPLVCGLLAQVYGWHVGFGVAGVMMLVATVIYLAGQRHLPENLPRRRERAPREPLTAADRRAVLLLFAVFAILVFPFTAYMQIWNAGLVWVSQHVDLSSPFGKVPTPWFNSIDSFASIIAVPPIVALWAWQARRGSEPGDIAKLGIGTAIAAGAALLLAAGAALFGEGQVPVIVPVLGWGGMGLAFVYFWPPVLALVSRAAPASLNATMVSLAYINLFVASFLMGWIGTFYEKMTPAQFWMLDAGVAGIGTLLVLIFGRRLARALEN
jgi:POT family proton-dependent oligopeptide transporter